MNGRRFSRWIVMVALVMMPVLALSATAVARGVTIRGVVSHWSPSSKTVHRGTKVTWTAASGTHTITAYGGNWRMNKRLPQGRSASHMFAMRGTYRFRCKIHSTLVRGRCRGMCGTITVR